MREERILVEIPVKSLLSLNIEYNLENFHQCVDFLWAAKLESNFLKYLSNRINNRRDYE